MDMNIEDVLPIVRFVLDYIGFDVDDWGVDFNYREWRRDVRHRNLVRLIGSYFVNTKVRRINFQEQLIGSHQGDPAMDSIFSFTADSILAEGDDGNRVWVEEEVADGCVEIRARLRDEINHENRYDLTLAGNTTGLESGLLHHPPGRTSTPLGLSMMSTHDDTFAHTKINALEDELAKLREQIAAIVVGQESILRGGNDVTHDAPQPDIPEPPSHQPDVVRCAPAPPPPPPAPPLPPLIPPLPQCATPDGKHSHNLTVTQEKKETHLKPTNLCDMLKDISNVKLRAIQRSPGGTPIRRAPRQDTHNDPASLIATALKKKFAHRRVALGSPTTDKENSSPECSPRSPVAPTKQSRRSKTFERRRSGLCGDNDSGFSALSPLAETSLR